MQNPKKYNKCLSKSSKLIASSILLPAVLCFNIAEADTVSSQNLDNEPNFEFAQQVPDSTVNQESSGDEILESNDNLEEDAPSDSTNEQLSEVEDSESDDIDNLNAEEIGSNTKFQEEPSTENQELSNVEDSESDDIDNLDEEELASNTESDNEEEAAQIVDSPLDEQVEQVIDENTIEQQTQTTIIDSISQNVSNIIDQFFNDAIGARSSEIIATNKNNSGVAAGDSVYKNNFWGKIFGGKAEQEKRNNVDGYQAETKGVAFGYDRKFDNDINAGLAIAYGTSNIDNDISQKTQTDINSYNIALYLNKDYGKFYSEGMLGYTYHDFSGKREIIGVGDVAKANWDGQQYSAKVGLGHIFNIPGSLELRPTSSLRYFYFKQDDYTETGAGANNLTVKADNINRLQSDLGLKISYPINQENVVITPAIDVHWKYDFLDIEAESLSINAISIYHSKGAKLARNSFDIKTALNITNYSGLSFDLEYGYGVKENFESHQGLLTAKINF